MKNKNNLNSHLIEGLSARGVPKNLIGTSFPFKYNDFNYFYNLMKKSRYWIVKMEVARNEMPRNNFWKIRDYTNKKGIILIFDEHKWF